MLQQKDIGNVQDDIEDAKAVLDLVRVSQVSSTIRDWLKAPDATVNFNEACKMKHPGTDLVRQRVLFFCLARKAQVLPVAKRFRRMRQVSAMFYSHTAHPPASQVKPAHRDRILLFHL